MFAGGWSLELAEIVCADALIGESDVVGLLGQLVEKSMVVMETRDRVARFRLLEPIRQYALELLETRARWRGSRQTRGGAGGAGGTARGATCGSG